MDMRIPSTRLPRPGKSHRAGNSLIHLSLLALAALFCPHCYAWENCPNPPGVRQQSASPMRASNYAAIGAVFEDKRQYACAAAAFRRAAALDPASASLQYSLGTSLYADRRMAEAEAALNRALALDSSLLPAHLVLGTIAHDEGKRAEALRHWEEALRIDPGSIAAIDWIAKTRIEAAQYTTAAALLRSAPDDEELLLDLIVADSKAGLFDEAITRGSNALAAHPDWTRVHTALATVLVQRNRFEEAAATLRAGMTKHPDDAAMKLLYLRVLILNADKVHARTLAEELLQQEPDSYDALYLNGLLEREEGNYSAALPHLQAAAALRANVYDPTYNLGLVLAKLQRPEEARAQLTKAIALDPSAPEAHFQLAAVLRTLGQAEAAQQELATYRQLMKDREKRDEAMTLTTRAAQSLEEGDAAVAVSMYKEACEDLPGDPQAYYRLAMAFDKLSAWDEESKALKKALELEHDFAAAQNQLGYVAARTGDNALAESYFRQAIQSQPDFAEAESNLGSLLANEDRDKEAEQHFQAALAANPRFTDAWINLAATLAGASRFNEARHAVATALQIEPENTDAAHLMQSLPPQKQ